MGINKMVYAFVDAALEGKENRTPAAQEGKAAEVVMKGYESIKLEKLVKVLY